MAKESKVCQECGGAGWTVFIKGEKIVCPRCGGSGRE